MSGGEPGLVDRVLPLHAGSRGFDSHWGHMSEQFFQSNRPGYLHPVSSELGNSGIRVAVGDCSVIEHRWWRPPYQTGKTVHVHTDTLQTWQGRMHCAGCVGQWFRTAEPLRERRYENWTTHYTHTVSFCILVTQCQHLQSANEIIMFGNSGPLIGWIHFHTFTCTGNITMWWEPDPPSHPPAEKFYL